VILAGKVAVVTGGGSGLGREIALAYAGEGAAVAVASNVPEQNEEVAELCRGLGPPALAHTLDGRDEEGVAALVDRTAQELGEADVLVAAAGLDVRRSARREDRYVANAALADWETVIAVNLTGTFLCVREAVRRMVPRGSGSIVTFTSGTVRRPLPGIGAYVASKVGIEGLTRVLALELEDTGVRANVLQPGGPTNTAFFPSFVEAEQRAQMHAPSIVRACAVHLASDESAGVSGQELVAAEWNRERGLVLCPCPACSAAA
jgi:NAD(P)-dependent dehydrogenase (short-subunit alcohol dehydrogenase family)